jgi:hypothetical protein
MNMTRFVKSLIHLKLTRLLNVSASMGIDLYGGTFLSAVSQKIITEHRIQCVDVRPTFFRSVRSYGIVFVSTDSSHAIRCNAFIGEPVLHCLCPLQRECLIRFPGSNIEHVTNRFI